MIIDTKDANRARAFLIAVTGLTLTQDIWEKQGLLLTFDLRQLIFIGVYMCGLLLFIFKDRNEYVQSKSIKSYLPTFTGLGILILNVGCYFYWDNTR